MEGLASRYKHFRILLLGVTAKVYLCKLFMHLLGHCITKMTYLLAHPRDSIDRACKREAIGKTL